MKGIEITMQDKSDSIEHSFNHLFDLNVYIDTDIRNESVQDRYDI
jgi:hypothetical protein